MGKKKNDEEISRWYDWSKVLSYNADVSFIITARGRGKTYGFRKQAVKDHIKYGYNFIQITRMIKQLDKVKNGYFDKLIAQGEFPDYVFKVEGYKGYIAKKTEEGEKPKWELLCYFVALNAQTDDKEATFFNVKKIMLDEAIIDRKRFPHKRYLPDEYQTLADVVDTVTRERPEDTFRPHLYLCSNACDLMNPYFVVYGIDKQPDFGFKWYKNKTVIMHYEDPGKYAEEKAENTLAGRMLKGTRGGEISSKNIFISYGESLIDKKPNNAKYEIGFAFKGDKIGVWLEINNGYFYITEKTIEDESHVVFSVTRDDATINRLHAYRTMPAVKVLIEANRMNLIRYENFHVRDVFLNILSLYGA